jgi:hypothetical protein
VRCGQPVQSAISRGQERRRMSWVHWRPMRQPDWIDAVIGVGSRNKPGVQAFVVAERAWKRKLLRLSKKNPLRRDLSRKYVAVPRGGRNLSTSDPCHYATTALIPSGEANPQVELPVRFAGAPRCQTASPPAPPAIPRGCLMAGTVGGSLLAVGRRTSPAARRTTGANP